LTGSVRFDDIGLRRDYKMDVLEVNRHRGLARVRRRCFFFVVIIAV